MNKAVQPSRAKAALLLVICTCMVTQAQQLPSDTAIARESVKQAPRTEAAISKAERQARQLRMPVPDVGRPPVLSVPDPAAIARSTALRHKRARPAPPLCYGACSVARLKRPRS